METDVSNHSQNKNRFNLSLDYRVIVLALLAVIVGMLIAWHPWDTSAQNDQQTIEVTGQAKVSAEPDEFLFYPAYEVRTENRQDAIDQLSKKSVEILAKLKELGVPDNKIKTDTSGYENVHYFDRTSEPIYTLRFTITLNSRDQAQKIQDYLVTTTPTGSISPQAQFSDAKRKELESKARDEATKEARSKADQSAKNLGFKVGKVKSVTDGSGFGDVIPLRGAAMDSRVAESKLAVQPGENELTYSVTVIYYVR